MTTSTNDKLNKDIKRGPGQPPLNLDLDEIYRLGLIHCTIKECAVLLDCSESTLNQSEEYMKVFKKGLEQGRKSLRRLQFEKAEGRDAKVLTDGAGYPIRDDKGRPMIIQPGYAPDTTMQIWLGKQQLGQTDTQNIRIDGEKRVEVIIKNYEKGEEKK